MKKYAVVVAICLTAVMVATVVFAAAVRLDLDPWPPGVGYGDGKAILNYAKGDDKTEVQVNCSGLTAGTWYRVYVGLPWTPLGDVQAKKNGKINFHTRCPGDVSGLTVRINELPGDFTILSSP